VATSPFCSLVTGGRGPLHVELERRGVQNAAIFLGRQPHTAIPELVAAMDIGVLLDSNAYGSPMKVFEYWRWASGVAPTVAGAGDPAYGETGLLIAPGDTEAMARQILRLARSQLRTRLGEAGRKYVLASPHLGSECRKDPRGVFRAPL